MITGAVQQALYDRLNSTPAIAGAVTGIFTDVPQATESEDDAAFPYISIGPFTGIPFDTKDGNGVNLLADVHVWSRSQSDLTWRVIATDIYSALQKHDDLPVVGANVVEVRFDNSVNFEDPDGKTKHCVLTFRIIYFIL